MDGPQECGGCTIRIAMHEDLPGADLISQGLQDLANGEISIHALLVSIGAPRLATNGIFIPGAKTEYPEMQLYLKLAEEDSDSAHSRYNALIRKLVSFERALERSRANEGP